QADAVGVVAADVPAEDEGIHRLRGSRSRRDLAAIAKGGLLERQRHVEATAAGGAKFVDGALEAIERRRDTLVGDVLAGGLREARMDGRRLRMGHRVSDDRVTLGHGAAITE